MAIFYAAVAVGVLLAAAQLRRRFDRRAIWLLLPILVCGLWGGRFVHELVFNGVGAMQALRTAHEDLGSGPASVMGSIAFGFFGALGAAHLLGYPLIGVTDAISASVAAAQAAGRVGCFFNGCCFGVVTDLPWGMRYSPDTFAGLYAMGRPLHPTQLYESALDAFLAVCLWRAKGTTQGVRTAIYLVSYASFRLIVQSYRADSRPRVVILVTAMCLGLLVTGLSIWVMARQSPLAGLGTRLGQE